MIVMKGCIEQSERGARVISAVEWGRSGDSDERLYRAERERGESDQCSGVGEVSRP